MRKLAKGMWSLVLVVALVLGMSGCAGASGAGQGEKIVNVGVTDTLGSFNPMAMDMTEINKYAAGLMFLPLVEMDADLNFQGMLADSITTEDNRNFIVHIDEAAVWSDGKPVTAEDVEYTVLRLASPIVANAFMMYYVFEGVGDDGFVEEGATSIDGVKVLDEKTIQFTTKAPMSLMTFENSYARYLHTLPKHIIEKYAEAELTTAEWFNKPDVISGPFFVTDFDAEHYISYQANPKYFKGAPKIDKLNIKIVDGSQLYAGLQSGEIDITQHTMSVIPQEDYESVEALENINVVYGSPITNLSVFIQTANVTDAKVRQALLCAIDRERILKELVKGHGEIVDGFLSSAGPFFDESIVPTAYDPEKAKSLLAEAGWDGTKTLRFFVNSGDTTFVNAAAVMAAQWAEVGINVEIQTKDMATLMSMAGSTDYDLFAVQYTYAPVDLYPDVTWLLSGEGSWTGYSDDTINQAMMDTQLTSDIEEIKKLYSVLDKKMQEDVPMFSAYVISAQGAVNKRLIGATPSVYGFFNNVQNWDVAQ